MLTGSCNCGAVRFTVTPDAQSASMCHCGQCRKQSGHYWASAQADETAFDITGNVHWYASSASAKRGFCPTCGCFLFWKHNDEDKMSFSLGTIDGPTGLIVDRHIFTAFKGDYYDIENDLPEQAQ